MMILLVGSKMFDALADNIDAMIPEVVEQLRHGSARIRFGRQSMQTYLCMWLHPVAQELKNSSHRFGFPAA
jgi:hypothetical protein